MSSHSEMNVVRLDISEPERRPSIVTVGTFDGVHVGHWDVLSKVVERAREHRQRSIVVTFDPHPRQVIHGKAFQVLSTLDERLAEFRRVGVHTCIIIPFTKEFAALSAEEFCAQYLVGKFGVTELFEGPDHHIGHNREAGMHTVKLLGEKLGFVVHQVDPVKLRGESVSSSLVRRCILDGNVEKAASLLGRPYVFSGEVVVGAKKGREFGFPTANLETTATPKVVPADGVYFSQIRIQDDASVYFGLASIGTRPTVMENGTRVVEAYILDFDRDIYGRRISIDFFRYIRAQRKFNSVAALIEQMDADKQHALGMRNRALKQVIVQNQ